MSESSLGHVPAREKWEFDEGVTECFEDMLRRSIPQYDVMRDAVHRLACRHVQAGTDVVDLGSSRGDALAPLIDKFGAHNRFHAVETSGPMLEVLRKRFRGMVDCGVVSVKEMDLRTAYPAARASATLCVLTLQFVPINYRQRILRQAFESTVPGGALIVVEKVLGAGALIDGAFVAEYHRQKNLNGYSGDEIERKAMSLEGVLVPLTAEWNEQMLRRAGFSDVDCFWRWMSFSGWIAVRDR